MPGRTLDVVLLSGIAGFVLFVCCAVSGVLAIGSLFDATEVSESVSDVSARKVSPRR